MNPGAPITEHLPDDRRVRVLYQFGFQVVRDDLVGLAAELAYRFFLAIFPFFILLASLGHLLTRWLGWPNPAQNVGELLGQVMPPDAAAVFQAEIASVLETTHLGMMSLGLAGALLLATGGTNGLIKAMNRAYGVEETRPFWTRYPLALGLTCLAWVAVAGAVLLFVSGWWFGSHVAARLGLEPAFQQLVELVYWPIVAMILAAGVAVLYWAGPNLQLRFRLALPGAVAFAVGWLLTTSLFAWYVEQLGGYGLTYGTLAGVVVLLIWFYLTALLLLVGIELNAVIGEQFDATRIAAQRQRTRDEAPVRQLPPSADGTAAVPAAASSGATDHEAA